ncbi:glycosyl hydrolase family 18 [Blautia liquoris]|uniref:Glycosyl hydrolase family 18 n=1 Tax=Blautia liquoris TaxID=2779518 RepID=A0A7M2RIK6_9FIRM|nr:glycosyl hydrolase family 18 protein [Blautia liquoris]QOV20163.1 glycosyl hydrolase family 18 [Blautia liquoris]
MKKRVMPVLIVIGLILAVLIVGVASLIIRRYTPTSKSADLAAYYGLEDETQAALIINDEVKKSAGLFRNGEVYMSYSDVESFLDTNFYLDEINQQMLLSDPSGIRALSDSDVTEKGAPALIRENDTYYLAVNYIKSYTDMVVNVYEKPARAVIRTRWSGLNQVTVTKDAAVRVRGGIRSDILENVKKGEKLVFLEKLDHWTKVSTQKGSIGYVENKSISEQKKAEDHIADTGLEFPSITKDYKLNLGFHQVTSQEANQALQEVISRTSGLNTVSPTWFSILDNGGTISSLASRDYVDQAHQMGLEVWGLIDNFNENVSVTEALKNSQTRGRIIAQLMDQASACGMDGINVDFEQLPKDSIPHFLQFLRELTIQAHQRNLVVSVDNPVPQNYNRYYKRGAQGKIVDYVIIMGYDEHFSGGDKAGSVSSLLFVENGIKQTLSEVPKEKVVNAIPFYTRVWTEAFGQELPTSEVLGMDGTDRYMQEHQMTKKWDEKIGQNIAISEDDSARYTIWVEDEQSIEEKMKVIQKYGLAGVAEWRLGMERNTVWDIINRYNT